MVAGECCDVASGHCFLPGQGPKGSSGHGSPVLGMGPGLGATVPARRGPYCSAEGSMYHAPPRVTCDPRPGAMSELSECGRADAPLVGRSPGRPHACGPAANAQCPWRKGQDLCCVSREASGGPAALGECLACDRLNVQERSRVLVWDDARWATWSWR